MFEPLRIRVRVDTAALPAWVAATLERLEAGGRAAIVALEAAPRPERRPARKRLVDLFHLVDRRLLGIGPDPDRTVDLDDRAPSDEVGTPAELVLDLSSGGAEPPRGVETWRPLVDGRPVAPPEPYFWSLYRGRRVCALSLQAVRPDGSRRSLAVGYSTVDRVSVARTRDPILRKVAELVARAVEQRARGELPVTGGDDGGADRLQGSGDVGAPQPWQLAFWSARVAARVAATTVRKTLGYDDWYLAFRPAAPVPEHADSLSKALVRAEPFRRLPQPPGVFRADPILLERDGRRYVFFEEYRRAEAKGHIAVGELGLDGFVGAPSACLECEHHLSYPFVFENEGAVFMVPESAECRRVDLYRATRFPFEWTLERTLLDGVAAVDPTLLRHDGRWWLFLNAFVPHTSSSDELFLYFATGLDGPWTPHPDNPIVVDVRCARPAGPLFRLGPDLVRPAQDGAGAYGSRIALRRVEVLTESAYRETPLGAVPPGWLPGAHATHTYGRDSGVEVTDGRCFTLRPHRPFR